MQETENPSEASMPVDGFAQEVKGDQVSFGPGFAVQVSAQEDVTMTEAGALAVAAGKDMDLSFGGAMLMAVGRDLQLTNGGALALAVGNDLVANNSVAVVYNMGGASQLLDCASVVVASPQVTAHRSVIGLLISSNTQLGEDTRVMVNTPQAVALGAALGAAFALFSWLLRRR